MLGYLKNALLVTAGVVALYPNIPHQDRLEALSAKLDQRKKISTDDLVDQFVVQKQLF